LKGTGVELKPMLNLADLDRQNGYIYGFRTSFLELLAYKTSKPFAEGLGRRNPELVTDCGILFIKQNFRETIPVNREVYETYARSTGKICQ
jgi:hypothetical protein